LLLRRANEADVIRFCGVATARRFFERFPDWYGEVGERNGAIHGFGGCGWDLKGRCWVFCCSDGYRAGKTAHGAALSLLADLKTVVTTIYAWRDDYVTSERWLRRLGFRHMDNIDGEEVWSWTPQPEETAVGQDAEGATWVSSPQS
jgi:hypothetical protein